MGKLCKTCGKPNKYPQNKYHFWECTPDDHFSKRVYSWPKKIGKKKIERLKTWWSEKLTFEKVWEREKICWISGVEINEPKTYSFAHILSKGQFPALRLFSSNIALVAWIDQHHKIDECVTRLRRAWKEEELKELILNNKFSEIKALVLSFL